MGTWNQRASRNETVVKMPVKASMKERGVTALQSIMARLETNEEDADVKDLKAVLENFRNSMLPPSLSGWLLLQRSGLNAQERATVLASAKNSLDVSAIEAALRDQWADAELRERDAHTRKAPGFKKAFLGEDGAEEGDEDAEEAEEEEEAHYGSEDDDELDLDELEGSEREAAEEALAVIRDQKSGQRSARRTLAQARAVVKDIKVGRGYYKPGTKGTKGPKGKSKGRGPCFTCGGPHFSRECPKNKDRNKDKDKDKDKGSAGFMAFSFAAAEDTTEEKKADDSGPEFAFSEWLLSAMREETRGKMVIDCGATRSLASIMALEDCLEEGDGSVTATVDPTNNTKFKFGDGLTKKTASRATLHFQAKAKHGGVKMYAMDTKGRYVPMLGSMEFLIKSGAIIDFQTGAAIFTKIDPDKVVMLERISSTHLVFPLCSDVYEQPCTDEAAAAAVKDLAGRQKAAGR